MGGFRSTHRWGWHCRALRWPSFGDDGWFVILVYWLPGTAGGAVSELPTGTVTFLFTDLESSTRLWEQDPEAMRDALAHHDELLRRAVEAHDGLWTRSRDFDWGD